MTVDGWIPEGFDLDKMDIEGLRSVIKMLMELMHYELDRLTHLQDRVLELERKL